MSRLVELLEDVRIEDLDTKTAAKARVLLNKAFQRKTTPVKQFELKNGLWSPSEGVFFLDKSEVHYSYLKLQTRLLVRDEAQEYSAFYFESEGLRGREIKEKGKEETRGVIISTSAYTHLYIRCV